MIKGRNLVILLTLTLLLLVLILLSLVTGPSDVGWGELSTALSTWGHTEPTSDSFILFQLRWPRTLAAVGVGASLGLSGLLLQTLLKNPLAEPYTLGVSGGATLGAVTALLLIPHASSVELALGSLVGCWIVASALILLLRTGRISENRGLILTGVMLSLFCGSFVSVMFSRFEPTQLQQAMSWMIGQVGTSRDEFYGPLLIVTALLFVYWWVRAVRLDHLLLGEDLARTLGTSAASLRLEIIISVALLTSLAVSVAGLIGFVGLIAPHLSYQLLKSRRHCLTLTAGPCIGALLLLSADVLGRALGGDREVPAGSVVALVGAPILISLLIRRQDGSMRPR